MLQFFKDLGRAFFIGMIVFLIRGLIMYINDVNIEMDENFYLDFVYNQMYAIVLYMANAYVLSYLLRHYKNRLFEIKYLLLDNRFPWFPQRGAHNVIIDSRIFALPIVSVRKLN